MYIEWIRINILNFKKPINDKDCTVNLDKCDQVYIYIKSMSIKINNNKVALTINCK